MNMGLNGYWNVPYDYVDEYGEIDWSFLENETGGLDISMPLYVFLHGYCDTFAFALHEQYGYEIEYARDEDNHLIHAYCVDYSGSTPLYIDIRGITDNFEELMEDFRDDFSHVDEVITLHGDPDEIFENISGNLQFEEVLLIAEALAEENDMIYDTDNLFTRHPSVQSREGEVQ